MGDAALEDLSSSGLVFFWICLVLKALNKEISVLFIVEQIFFYYLPTYYKGLSRYTRVSRRRPSTLEAALRCVMCNIWCKLAPKRFLMGKAWIPEQISPYYVQWPLAAAQASPSTASSNFYDLNTSKLLLVAHLQPRGPSSKHLMNNHLEGANYFIFIVLLNLPICFDYCLT